MKIKITFADCGFEHGWRLMLLSAFCVFVFAPSVIAQTEPSVCRTDCQCGAAQKSAPVELRFGETLKQQFEKGGAAAHFYQIKLPALQFVRVQIEQTGVDVFGCVCESKQKFDASAKSGVEEFSFISNSESIYSFAVQPFEAGSGDYTVRIAEMRPATETDAKRVDAENIFREAGLMRDADCLEAAAQYNLAKEKFEQISSSSFCADCQFKLAVILYRLGGYAAAEGKHAEAKLNFERVLKLLENQRKPELKNLEFQWLALTDLGLALSRLGDFSAAREKLERAKFLIKANLSDNFQKDYARLLNIYANLLIATGEPTLALAAIEEGLINQPEEDVKASLILNKGLASDALGDSYAALGLYEQALKISQNQADRAKMLINSGVIRERFGELDIAETDFANALKIGKSANLLETEAFASRSLGAFYLNSFGATKIVEAREKLAFALESFQKLDNSFEVEKTKIYLAAALYQEKRLPEAARIYQEAKLNLNCDGAANAAAQAASLCGLIFNNAGAIYYEQKDYANARADFRQALKLRQAVSDLSGQAETNHNLAVLETRAAASNQSAMFDYFNAARALYQKIRDRRGESAVLYEMAKAAPKNSKPEAVGYLRAALKNASDFSRRLPTDDLRLGANATAADYWKLYLALSIDEKHAPSQTLGLQLSEAARAQSLRQNLQESNVRLEAENLPECRDLSADKEQYGKVLRGRTEKEQALKNTQLAENQKEAIRKEIDALDAETTRLTGNLKRLCPKFANLAFSAIPESETTAGIEKIQTLIDNETTVLEYALGDDSSNLWIITDQEISYYPLPNRKIIEAQTRLVRGMLTDKKRFFLPLDANYKTAIEKLSDLILPAALLKSVPAQSKLIVIADGELLNLPFAILPVSRGEKLLIENFEIGYLQSLSVLEEMRAKRELLKPEKRQRHLALFSSPVFTASDNKFPPAKKTTMSADTACAGCLKFEPLYYVRENDCRLVDTFLDSKSRIPSNNSSSCACTNPSCGTENKILWKRVWEATKQNFVTAQLSDYTDIILLTHGVYSAEKSKTGAEQSGLYFSYFAENGVLFKPAEYLLQPNDIYKLKLNQSLVTLGACETSLGNKQSGEGLLNLTRGFIWAGANGVTATLWSVEEETTMNTILQMNRAMLKENLSPVAALRQAQLEARKNNPDPRRWAGIIFYGDWKTEF